MGWLRFGVGLGFRAMDDAARPETPIVLLLLLVVGSVMAVVLGVVVVAGAIWMTAPQAVPWIVGAGVALVVLVVALWMWRSSVRATRTAAAAAVRDAEAAASFDELSAAINEPGVMMLEVLGADQHPNGSYAIIRPVEVDGMVFEEVWFDRIPVYAPLWIAAVPVVADKPGHWPAKWLEVATIPLWFTPETAAAWWRHHDRQEAAARLESGSGKARSKRAASTAKASS